MLFETFEVPFPLVPPEAILRTIPLLYGSAG
jgi:hypothetical protein